MSSGKNGDLDPEKTRLTAEPSGADNDKTHALTDLGAVAELRAVLQAPGPNDKLTLPLYAMADTVIVGRGTACDWQLDDVSLSRKHAQFRWSGLKGGLTVEDLGSANGTRVNGRPCRGETKVLPGEPVQLGTVIISLQLKSAKPATTDEQATRLVQQPDQPISAEESEPSLTPLPPAKTVLRPPPERGVANQFAQVFRPEKDSARPDEPTRSWDTRAVLVRAPEKAFDPEWLDQIKNMWRTNRRPLVLAGAAAWIALLLIVWASVEKGQQEEDDAFPPSMPTAKAPKKPATPPKPPTEMTTKPVVTPIPTPPAETPPATPTLQPEDSDHAAAMEQAIAAYDQGRMTEALSIFRRLAADPKDPTSKFMVDLIESRQGATP
jgi:pSer/pThr/pTyr-binding forkhead associated (FHA) protein